MEILVPSPRFGHVLVCPVEHLVRPPVLQAALRELCSSYRQHGPLGHLGPLGRLGTSEICPSGPRHGHRRVHNTKHTDRRDLIRTDQNPNVIHVNHSANPHRE